MDHHADERDLQLLAQDRYTIAVLSRILSGSCELVMTDHQRFILCHSTSPYPVWIWTPDGLTAEEIARAWQLATQARPLASGYRYNLKYELAEHFIGIARKAGLNAVIATNLYAYDCPSPIPPVHTVDGALYRCTESDIDEVAVLICQFHDEIGEKQMDAQSSRIKAAQYISDNAFFLWKNAERATVACCSYKPNGGLGCLGSVYTIPAFRRKHYAQHMVYQVTQLVSNMGLLPMLYTDADYAASNACYEKIGYVLRGKLCTIAVH